MTIEFCENESCESVAAVFVAISVNTYGDKLYALCHPCASAFAGGIQHGTFRTVSHMASPCDHPMGERGPGDVVNPTAEMFTESGEITQRVRVATAIQE